MVVLILYNHNALSLSTLKTQINGTTEEQARRCVPIWMPSLRPLRSAQSLVLLCVLDRLGRK